MKQKIIKNLVYPHTKRFWCELVKRAEVFVTIIAFILINGIFVLSASASNTNGTIDSTYKYAWSENTGWINFGCDNCDVHITDSGLSGYALSETIGWIYLGDITNDGEGNLSGYAWSENAGWIKFNPTNGGVVINSSGEFTGSALGENIGWIIFDNCDYQVKTDWRPRSVRPACNNSLDDDGDGKIDYPNDPGCNSLTDNDETDPGIGIPPAAYSPPTPPVATTEAPAGFSILINNGAKYTNSKTVTLKLNAGSDTAKMAISNYSDFKNASQVDYQKEIKWELSNCKPTTNFYRERNTCIVYAKFYTQYGQPSQIVSDKIILDTTAPKIKITKVKDYYSSAKDVVLLAKTEANAKVILKWDKKYGLLYADNQGNLTINLGKMSAGDYQLEMTATDLAGNIGEKSIIRLTIKQIEEVSKAEPEVIPKTTKNKLHLPIKQESKRPIIKKIIRKLKPLIPKFLKPKKNKEKEKEKLEKMIVIPKETPLSMRGQWKFLPKESIRTFVLSPLPKKIRELAEKFPKLGQTLKKVGITKITDVEKLKAVKLTLPGLKKIEKMPTEIVFAKTGGEKIDFNIGLSVTKKGEPQQKITTISGKPLQLVVKPDKPVKSVKGYIVWKQRKISRMTNDKFLISNKMPNALMSNVKSALGIGHSDFDISLGIRNWKLEIPLNSLLSSMIFAHPSFAKTYEPKEIETRLVLSEFEYTDPDGDGIYTANIQAPRVEGEYEIITVMDYKDPTLGKKEIRLITVVDPEGYVYTQLPEGKMRIAGAVVSLYWLNPKTKKYELWPAKEYQQENPQITDDTGKYSFLVPQGIYYLKVEHPDYPVYQSKTFVVKEGSGIHTNIELKTKYWWLKVINWKTILLIVVILLLMYNFYRDRIREKLLRK